MFHKISTMYSVVICGVYLEFHGTGEDFTNFENR